MSVAPIITDLPNDWHLPEKLALLNASHIIMVMDTGSKRHCYPLVKEYIGNHKSITIPQGDANKNIASCEIIWSALTKYQADRNTLIIALGGGMVTDLVGFCAATYKRGVRCVYISTTLLGIVDAAAGGKTGINFHSLKNLLGVFQEPEAIFHSTQFLETLPEKEILSGWAEVIKHCLIADKAQWERLKILEWEEVNWTQVIAHSIGIKQSIVSQDPHENGIRKALNFGHTAGHAIESCLLEANKPVPHGYAVAAGMIIETYISYKKGLLSKEHFMDIEEYLFTRFGRLSLKQIPTEEIIRYAQNDKKNTGRQINVSLLNGIGGVAINQTVTSSQLRAGIEYYKS